VEKTIYRGKLCPVSPSLKGVWTNFCKPEVFDGDPEKCSGFLLQCSVFFSNTPPTTDKAKIGFIVSRLSGKALEWATAVWDSVSESSYDAFLMTFRSELDARQLLLHIRALSLSQKKRKYKQTQGPVQH
uniref:DUF4939 domain-containing protein n=1 Tax=Astyanax mexicanus TaxID=7994 RepID=A0A3B1IDC4_ASTMX